MRHKINDNFKTERTFVKSVNFETAEERQSLPSTSFVILFVFVSTVIVAQVWSALVGSYQGKDSFHINTSPIRQQVSPSLKHMLGNDDKCGITTGGQEECYFQCEITYCGQQTGQINSTISYLQKSGKIIRIIINLLDTDQIKQPIANRIREVLANNPDEFDFGVIVALIPDLVASYEIMPIISDLLGPTHITKDLPCLEKCYPNTCFTSLLVDVHERGICNLNTEDKIVGDEIKISSKCELIGKNGFILGTKIPINITVIKEGTCSRKTESSLMSEDCFQSMLHQQGYIRNTILYLIMNSCSKRVTEYYARIFIKIIINNLERYSLDELLPKNSVMRNLANISSVESRSPTDILWIQGSQPHPFENTLHRYPWVCSLRTKGKPADHLCAVNLLSIPPKPTVVISPAHCTYVCKNSFGKQVEVCCCSEGNINCSEDTLKCGFDPKVYEMTGDDAEIVCGEHDTSFLPEFLGSEKYHVVLRILEIVRHPNFDTESGPTEGNDIAIFKVEDTELQDGKAEQLGINPVCLPILGGTLPRFGIHFGWSTAPPFIWTLYFFPGMINYYKDLYKPWHHKMELTPCEDAQTTETTFCGGPLKYPSNSSFPEGLICAVDMQRTCPFFEGDSGSPLMVKDPKNEGRFIIEGMLSFVKGCDLFSFGSLEYNRKKIYQINLKTENPSAYTRLSCYLPWIAKQYDMEYSDTGDLDKECFTGSGGIEEVDKKTCTGLPSNHIEMEDGELECIFPFYYLGKLYNECYILNELGFVWPSFRCPTRDILNIPRINGTLVMPNNTVGPKLCLSDPDNTSSPLDLEKEDCPPASRRPLSSVCKKDCPGVTAYSILGGGVILGAAAASGGITTLAPLSVAGILGLLGVGGAGFMITQEMCITPYCQALSGQCCLVVFSLNGIVCPQRC